VVPAGDLSVDGEAPDGGDGDAADPIGGDVSVATSGRDREQVRDDAAVDLVQQFAREIDVDVVGDAANRWGDMLVSA
jgi:hypothetical protein